MSPIEAPTRVGLIESRKDVRAAAKLLGVSEIAWLVSTYYQVQKFRVAAGNMSTQMEKADKPHNLVTWVALSQHRIEDDIRAALDTWCKTDLTATWARSIIGIGPTLAAALRSHIDPEKAWTASSVWRFAGLDPSLTWGKGEKRPWNADLKQLCYLIGESFVKTSNHADSVYGKVYRDRKAMYVERNGAGGYAAAAVETLATRRIQDKATRECYEAGQLPAGRIDLRARRMAVKLFLSHFHAVLTWYELGRMAPRPYAIEHMGHAHLLEVPNAPWPADQKWTPAPSRAAG